MSKRQKRKLTYQQTLLKGFAATTKTPKASDAFGVFSCLDGDRGYRILTIIMIPEKIPFGSGTCYGWHIRNRCHHVLTEPKKFIKLCNRKPQYLELAFRNKSENASLTRILDTARTGSSL